MGDQRMEADHLPETSIEIRRDDSGLREKLRMTSPKRQRQPGTRGVTFAFAALTLALVVGMGIAIAIAVKNGLPILIALAVAAYGAIRMADFLRVMNRWNRRRGEHER